MNKHNEARPVSEPPQWPKEGDPVHLMVVIVGIITICTAVGITGLIIHKFNEKDGVNEVPTIPNQSIKYFDSPS